MEPITLLLADDHALMRHGLHQDLEHATDLVVVAEAGSVREAVASARQHRPQIAIVDVRLPDGTGIDACRQIVAGCAGTAVIILSTDDWDMYLARSWAAGAAAFVVKTAKRGELVQVIRAVSQGQRVFTPAQRQRIRTWQQEVEARLQALTPREVAVLRLIVAEYTNPEIAGKLGIAVRTVECHVGQILAKLELASRRDVRAWAKRTRALDVE